MRPPRTILLTIAFFWAFPSWVFAVESVRSDNGIVPVIEIGEREQIDGAFSLREAVIIALKSNPELEVERESMAATEFGVELARAAFDPVFSASSRANYSRQPQASSDLDGAAQPESDAVDATLGLEKVFRSGGEIGLNWQPLDRSSSNSSFARLNPAYSSELGLEFRQPLLGGSGRENVIDEELALVRVVSGRFDVERVVIEVLERVETAYWTAGAAEKALDIRRQSLELAQVILEETEARDSSKVEELEARSNVLESEAEVFEAEKLVADAKDDLLRQMGVLGAVESGELRLDAVRIPDDVRSLIDPEASYSRVLENSPRIALQRGRLDERELTNERARLQLRPTLDVTAGVGVLGRDGDFSGSWSGVGNQDGRAASAGLTFSIPWGNRAERARVAQAESELRQERLRVHAERMDIYAEVRAACRSVEAALKRLESADARVEVNEVRVQEQLLRRKNGDGALRDLLEAQADLDEARLARVRTRVEVLNTLAQLRALDGGLPEALGVRFSKVEIIDQERK